jgi:serine protease Do
MMLIRHFGTGRIATAVAAIAIPTLAFSASAVIPQFPTCQAAHTLAPLLREVVPGVVNIAVKGQVKEDNPLYKDFFFRQFLKVPKQIEKDFEAAGSGVIIDADHGYVLTNNHVIENASDIKVTTKDGRTLDATLVGRDAPTDVAVVKIQSATSLRALPLGDSDKLEVGDFVVAIGNPFALGQTVTSGIVSALGRSGLGFEGYEDFIQTDAPINPGNSGGALVSLCGELVGINTAILAPSGGNVGIGFAIPINMAREVMNEILQHGEVRRGLIGVNLQDLTPELASQLHVSASQGAVVTEVLTNSPAERAGIRKGDVIVAIDGTPVQNATQLRNKIGLMPIGHRVELGIERSGVTLEVTMEIAPQQNAAGGEETQSGLAADKKKLPQSTAP